MCVEIRGKFPHQRVCVRWICGNVLPSTDYGMITTGEDWLATASSYSPLPPLFGWHNLSADCPLNKINGGWGKGSGECQGTKQ